MTSRDRAAKRAKTEVSPEERSVAAAVEGTNFREVARAVLAVKEERLTPDSVAVTHRDAYYARDAECEAALRDWSAAALM